jgi:hypothetical protein
MKDKILQEVREARAAVAADFDFDLHKFFAWSETHAAAERKAKQLLPTNLSETLNTRAGSSKFPAIDKRRMRRNASVIA